MRLLFGSGLQGKKLIFNKLSNGGWFDYDNLKRNQTNYCIKMLILGQFDCGSETHGISSVGKKVSKKTERSYNYKLYERRPRTCTSLMKLLKCSSSEKQFREILRLYVKYWHLSLIFIKCLNKLSE